MKVLYKDKFTYQLNDSIVTNYSSCWHYGKLPKKEKKEHDFYALKNICGFSAKYSLFKKRVIEVYISPYYSTSTKRKEFKSASTTKEPCEINLNQVSFKDLTEHLSLADYIEWCKDNNIAPITKE